MSAPSPLLPPPPKVEQSPLASPLPLAHVPLPFLPSGRLPRTPRSGQSQTFRNFFSQRA